MKTVVLDAMIRREDFAKIGSQSSDANNLKTISIETLKDSGFLIQLLRKPDFQRETNQWTPEQVVSFLESYLNDELIPSIILWSSQSYTFVIDGGHRLSALRAWINNDYGDGSISISFYSNSISNGQKKSAKKTRELVESCIGTYELHQAALFKPESYDLNLVQRARTMAKRQLDLQWVNGDANKAETSFFKINTQGTPLDITEEKLLRNRGRNIAIASRSIVRAATGHSYWSKFDNDKKLQIESKSKSIHESLFNPELETPIKTLELPIGGTQSPIDALELLLDVIEVICADFGKKRKQIEEFPEDNTGELTISLLDDCARVINWMSGSNSNSLGLHPAVYYYSHRGRHVKDLFIGIIYLFRSKIENNDKLFFKKFTSVRSTLEDILVLREESIMQAMQTARSNTRFERYAALVDFLINKIINDKINSAVEFNDELWLEYIVPNFGTKILLQSKNDNGSKFSKDDKSSIFLNQAINSAIRCPICNGYMEPSKSATFDHMVPLREGGKSSPLNGQITHPYCNSAYKN